MQLEIRNLDAPFTFKNWLASLEDRPSHGMLEFPLLSDGFVGGKPLTTNFGPYQFAKVLKSSSQYGLVQPTLVVRLKYHTQAKGYWSETGRRRIDNFQGERPIDEISALASLALGVRFRAGDVSRRFSEDGDPYGTPMASRDRRDPVLLSGSEGLILPSACDSYYRSVPIEALKPFGLLPRLQPGDVIALLHAARLYQDALWIVESEPSLAWVMLVSAVETAANHWARDDTDSVEILRDTRSDLFELLERTDNRHLIQSVADYVAANMKSTKKFLDFCKNFCPPAPPKRPENEYLRHPWSNTKLRKALNTIYSHRSKMLHAGLPFPIQLCEAPARSGNSYQEVPEAEDSPEGCIEGQDDSLMLHAFEYIVRESLLKWWKSMSSEA